MLTAVASVSEGSVIFLQLMLFPNTAAFFILEIISMFFYSLLGLVSNCVWKGDSGEEISKWWRCVEKINHSRDSWLVLRSLQAFSFHIYRAILESFFFCLQRHRIDSFVLVSFFLEKHYIPHSAVLSFTNMLRLCQIIPMLWSRWLLFSVW